jgi:AMMECR1 domain-containing protein
MTPKYTNLAEEVIRNTIRSANEDPRFDPVKKRELPSLIFSVDVLIPLEKLTIYRNRTSNNSDWWSVGKINKACYYPILTTSKPPTSNSKSA